METPEITPDTDHPDNDVRSDLEKIRQLLVSVLVLMFVISGTFNIYLARQVKSSRADVKGMTPQTQNMVADYQHRDGPAIERFITRMREFGQTHTDFVPILAKYNLKPAVAAPLPSLPAPSATPRSNSVPAPTKK